MVSNGMLQRHAEVETSGSTLPVCIFMVANRRISGCMATDIATDKAEACEALGLA